MKKILLAHDGSVSSDKALKKDDRNCRKIQFFHNCHLGCAWTLSYGINQYWQG